MRALLLHTVENESEIVIPVFCMYCVYAMYLLIWVFVFSRKSPLTVKPVIHGH